MIYCSGIYWVCYVWSLCLCDSPCDYCGLVWHIYLMSHQRVFCDHKSCGCHWMTKVWHCDNCHTKVLILQHLCDTLYIKLAAVITLCDKCHNVIPLSSSDIHSSCRHNSHKGLVTQAQGNTNREILVKYMVLLIYVKKMAKAKQFTNGFKSGLTITG